MYKAQLTLLSNQISKNNMPSPIAIKVILARSPYQVIINEPTQISTKVELRIWNKPNTRPATPTYIMSEGIASITQKETNYNISPFILEYIDKFALDYLSTNVTFAGNKEWCIGEYKTFYSVDNVNWILIDTIEFVGVNGYSRVEQGMNYDIADPYPFLLQANPDVKVFWNTIIPYYNFIVKSTNTYSANWYDENDNLLKNEIFHYGVNDYFNYAIPLVYNNSVKMQINNETDFFGIYTIYTEEICEPLYPVQIVWFVNHYGGWNYLPFFKASFNSIDVKNSDYNLMQKNVNYDPRKGQMQVFNVNGNEKIRLNTGWVTEEFFDFIQDIMLSDRILYTNDERPLILKTTSMDKKTYINDKNINYTLEFEFSNKLLNNIV
jgi:hypothetical protein